MVQKLSGFAKFDLDTKVNSYQFYKFFESLCSVEREVEKEITNDNGEKEIVYDKEMVIDNEKFGMYIGVFEKAFKEG